MFLLERFFCCLWGCGSVLIVDSAVPVCSLSVCICTLKFWEEKKNNTNNHVMHIRSFSVCLYTEVHTTTAGGHTLITMSVYSLFFSTITHTDSSQRHTRACAHLPRLHSATHTNTHADILLSHTYSVLLVCFLPFFMPSCSSWKGEGGGGAGITMCDATCFHQVWISNQTHPFFSPIPSTSIFSNPIPSSSSPSSPIRAPSLYPSLPPPSSSTLHHFFSLSFPLYKVFQIYHLYIMTYGYDNVLYYGKMRDLFLLLVCFIIPFLNWYCNISMQGTVRWIVFI